MVNEVQCSKAPDEWVELKNVGDAPLSTAGFFVGDAVDDRDGAVAVPVAVVRAGGYVVVRGDLGLSCDADEAVLFLGDEVVDRAPVRAPSDADLATWGRVPDGKGAFALTPETPGRANRPFIDERDSVFADGVARVDLFVNVDEETRLRNEGKDAGYLPARLRFTGADGVASPVQRVDVRIKGSITRRPWDGKPSLKIHFARHDGAGPRELRGLRKLTLNNLTYDPSFIRERLAFAVMRAVGHPGARTGWAEVFVNGTPKGLYSTIETYDRVFLADHHDETVVMYESDGQTPVGMLGGFDVDEGVDDFAPLLALASRLEQVAGTSGELDLRASIPEIDWLQIARTMALEDLIAHFDGHRGAAHNFFLHLDGGGRWTMLPWSVDLSMVTQGSIGGGPIASSGLFAQLCDRDPQCRAWFERARDDAAQAVLAEDWTTRVVDWSTLLAGYARSVDEPFSGNEFWNGVTTDVVGNARDAVLLLRSRAESIRCATAAARGIVDNDDPGCSGFAADVVRSLP